MSAAARDTASPEWKLECLARHVCRMPTKGHRLAFLDLMRKKHTSEFMANIEQQIREQWVVLHAPAQVNKEQHGNA